jgi:hypothetical protein
LSAFEKKSIDVMKPCQIVKKESTQQSERERNKGARTKVRASKQPKIEAGHKEVRESLSTETSTSPLEEY